MNSIFKTLCWIIFALCVIGYFLPDNGGGAELENGVWTIRAQSYLEVGTIGINLERFGTDVYDFANLSTVAEEYSGEDLTDELEEAALKLGFSLEDLT